MPISEYSDQQIVDGIINNNRKVVEYFFFKKCSALLGYIVYSVFDGKVDTNELISELYLYLSENNWNKIKQFDFRSKLLTWVSVVAIRFFQKRREALIETESKETLIWKQNDLKMTFNTNLEQSMDIRNALNRIPNERYKMVISELDLNDVRPEELASKMDVTVANLYNIHKRALTQLRLVMSRKEDYYD